VHGFILLLYLIPPWLGGGAAMAVTVLLHALWLCKQQLGALPHKLYIQSDNGTENKNKVGNAACGGHVLSCCGRHSCTHFVAWCTSFASSMWSGTCSFLATPMRTLMLGSASSPGEATSCMCTAAAVLQCCG
jgi:hypothetical protein